MSSNPDLEENKADVRLLFEVVREFCASRGYGFTNMSDGWLLGIRIQSRVHFVFGYDVGLNPSASSQLANDKGATFEALQAAGVPAIEHALFHAPRKTPYVSSGGNWRNFLALFDLWNGDVVCKPHMGTGGDQVYRVRSPRELEEVTQELFLSNRALTISPYVEFADEFRVIILDGELRLAYRKERPSLIGDGVSTVGALLASSQSAARSSQVGSAVDFSRVPLAGEVVLLEWRHNLGQGAHPVTLNKDACKDVIMLAAKAMGEIGLRFASVDIAAGPELKVLEINSGVMLDRFAKSDRLNRELATSIYEDALDRAVQPFRSTTRDLDRRRGASAPSDRA